MQILNPQTGLLPYPNAGLGQSIADTFTTYVETKRKNEEDQAKKKLDLYLKSGEILGEFDKPTPDIQKAFIKVYGMNPTGIFATGGKTPARKEKELDMIKTRMDINKTDAEIRSLGATSKRTEAMTNWYNRRSAGEDTPGKLKIKALDYAVKYANAKLGKPFEVLSDDERGLWQSYHDEGLAEFNLNTTSSTEPSSKSKPITKLNTYNGDQQAFITKMKGLSKEDLNSLVSNPTYKRRFENTLNRLGLSRLDVFDE